MLSRPIHFAVKLREDGRVRVACQRVTRTMRPAPKDWRYVMYNPAAVTCYECLRRMPANAEAGC